MIGFHWHQPGSLMHANIVLTSIAAITPTRIAHHADQHLLRAQQISKTCTGCCRDAPTISRLLCSTVTVATTLLPYHQSKELAYQCSPSACHFWTSPSLTTQMQQALRFNGTTHLAYKALLCNLQAPAAAPLAALWRKRQHALQTCQTTSSRMTTIGLPCTFRATSAPTLLLLSTMPAIEGQLTSK